MEERGNFERVLDNWKQRVVSFEGLGMAVTVA
jgi:hypothetical protein